MKVLFVISSLILASQALLTDEQKARIKEMYMACLPESGLDIEIAKKAAAGEYPNDPKLKKQMLCFHKKGGIQNEDGKLNPEKIKEELMKILKDGAVVDDIMKKCLAEKDTPEETAYYVGKCFHENSPEKDFV